jgi:protocatechuate 3,4-dioxygenase beta subunit
VESGRTTGRLEFTLRSATTFAVAGAIVDATGHPARGVTVSIDAAWPLFGGEKGSTLTDAYGRFQLRSLIPEDYRL